MRGWSARFRDWDVKGGWDMTLEVISSGFGRRGTKSLKAALERLGYGPCHHMHEIVENPGQVAHWQKLAAG